MAFISLASPDDIRIGLNFKAGSLKQRNPALQPSGSRRRALTWIVGGTQTLNSERTDRRHLRDVLAGLVLPASRPRIQVERPAPCRRRTDRCRTRPNVGGVDPSAAVFQ